MSIITTNNVTLHHITFIHSVNATKMEDNILQIHPILSLLYKKWTNFWVPFFQNFHEDFCLARPL